MKKYRVLIIPAGSGMAVAAIRSLSRDKKIKVICADSDRLAPGFYLSSGGYIVPPFNDTCFFEVLKNICRKEKIDVIIPALDNILYDFSLKKEEFEKEGVKVLVSSPSTIEITRDKWKTYLKLRGVVPLPLSFISKENIKCDFPLIIKPRNGSGSKDVYKVFSEEELGFFYKKVKNPVIQEYLEGREYTVDCLADKEGNLMFCVARERIQTKAGISVKGRIVGEQVFEEMAQKIVGNIRFFGPFFFQAKEDKDKIPRLTEINPRISGAMSFSSAAGLNIYSIAVRMCMGEKIRVGFPLKRCSGLYLTRYLEDIYIPENKMKRFLKNVM